MISKIKSVFKPPPWVLSAGDLAKQEDVIKDTCQTSQREVCTPARARSSLLCKETLPTRPARGSFTTSSCSASSKSKFSAAVLKNSHGLTLIEVLIALAIFVTSFMALIDSQNMNVKISAKSKRLTTATLLAEEKMSEMLLKYQGKSFSEIPEKEEGKFEEPNEKYSWEKSSRDFNYDLSFLVEMTQGESEEGDEPPQSPLMNYLPKISKFINKSSKEITVTVFWKEGGAKRKIAITTHLFDYKAPVAL